MSYLNSTKTCSAGFLISFSGIDGAGKSTIAKKLQTYLYEYHGYMSSYLWCKYGEHPLSHLHLHRLGYRIYSSFKITSKKIKDTNNNHRTVAHNLYKVYGWFLFILHVIQIFTKVWLPLRRGEIVICDRYIFDTMVDLQQELDYSLDRAQSIFSFYWIPQPNKKFLFDLPIQVAFQRKKETESKSFLSERRNLYGVIAQNYGLCVIDASQPCEKVFEQVIKAIETENFTNVKK